MKKRLVLSEAEGGLLVVVHIIQEAEAALGFEYALNLGVDV